MSNIEFKLEDDFISLCDLLKRVGSCETGGMAKQMIASEEVKVNGEIETRKRYKTRSGDIVEILEDKITVL